MEKAYEELSKLAKKGVNKFASLKTSKCMIKYRDKFRGKTGNNPYNVELKEEFFKFVAKNNVKC